MKSKRILWGISGLALLIGGLSLSLDYKDNKVVETSAYNEDSVAVVTKLDEVHEFSSFSVAWVYACNNGNDYPTTFKLLQDWTAVSGSFGTGTGFGSTGGLRLIHGAGGDVQIDLNGHNIDRGLTSSVVDGSVLSIDYYDTSITPTLKDSSTNDVSKQGKIMGGYTTSNGGGIFIDRESHLNILCGNITGNKADVYGGGIFVSGYGSLNMTGGRVYENIGNAINQLRDGGIGGIYNGGDCEIINASVDHNYTYGVCMAGFFAGAGITVGGSVTINDNYCDVTFNDGVPDLSNADPWNVSLATGKDYLINCSTSTPIEEWSSIGIYVLEKNTVITTTNDKDLSRFFTSDCSDFAAVTNDDGVVEIILSDIPRTFVKNWRKMRDDNHSICAAINTDAMGALLIEYAGFSPEYVDIVDNTIEYEGVLIGESIDYVKAHRIWETSSSYNAIKEYPYLTESIILGAVSITSLLAFVFYYRKRKRA